MKIISFLIILIVLFVGVTFAVLNAQLVTINYYLNTQQLPLSLLLVMVLGIGAVIGWFTGAWMWLRAKAQGRRLANKLSIAEKEIARLRTAPLNESL